MRRLICHDVISIGDVKRRGLTSPSFHGGSDPRVVSRETFKTLASVRYGGLRQFHFSKPPAPLLLDVTPPGHLLPDVSKPPIQFLADDRPVEEVDELPILRIVKGEQMTADAAVSYEALSISHARPR